jgi:hypothetical protein
MANAYLLEAGTDHYQLEDGSGNYLIDRTVSVTHRVATTDTSNATSYVSGAFTPATGDLLIMFVAVSASTVIGTATASANGITFTNITSALRGGGTDTLFAFVSDQLVGASPVSMTVTYDCTGDAGTGAITFVASVGGMIKTGPAAIRQSAFNENFPVGNPVVQFNETPLITNPQLVFVGNATVTAATVTPPTNFTEGADVGYTTPDRGAEYAWRVSGGATSTVVWGSSSTTATGSIGLELDASDSVPPTPTNQYIVDISHTGSKETGGVASVTPALPTGWQANDIFFLVVAAAGSTVTFTKPSGWTQIEDATAGNERLYLAYRVAQAGDTSPTVTLSILNNCQCALAAIRNVDTADPFGTPSHLDSSSASTITFQDITPRYATDFLVRIVTTRNATTGTVREIASDPDGGVGDTVVRAADISTYQLGGANMALGIWTQNLTATTAAGADVVNVNIDTVAYSTDSICFKLKPTVVAETSFVGVIPI